MDLIGLIIELTETTCGEACWQARENICRCSCGGQNHGCLRTNDGTRPQRTAKIDGFRYKLVAVGPRAEIYDDARKINQLAGWSAVQAAGPMTYHYTWASSERGAPARLRSASKEQIARWPELAAYRGMSRPDFYHKDISLVWARLDTPVKARCKTKCEKCDKLYAEIVQQQKTVNEQLPA